MTEITVTTDSEGVSHYSCGCRDWVVGGNYFYFPCERSPDCKVFKHVMDASKEQGNAISMRVEGKTT